MAKFPEIRGVEPFLEMCNSGNRRPSPHLDPYHSGAQIRGREGGNLGEICPPWCAAQEAFSLLHLPNAAASDC